MFSDYADRRRLPVTGRATPHRRRDRLLGITPEVKTIHHGPTGTLGYSYFTYYDPAPRTAAIPPAEPKWVPQGQHESFLSKLPNGEYLLPAGRFLTPEDQQLLAVTPDIKIIHAGPRGTSGYFFATQYDPAAMAEYNRHNLRGLAVPGN